MKLLIIIYLQYIKNIFFIQCKITFMGIKIIYNNELLFIYNYILEIYYFQLHSDMNVQKYIIIY